MGKNTNPLAVGKETGNPGSGSVIEEGMKTAGQGREDPWTRVSAGG
jgi:hypothetical protein